MTQNTDNSTEFVEKWLSGLKDDVPDNEPPSIRKKVLDCVEINRSKSTGELSENGLLSGLIALAKQMEETNGD